MLLERTNTEIIHTDMFNNGILPRRMRVKFYMSHQMTLPYRKLGQLIGLLSLYNLINLEHPKAKIRSFYH